MELFCTLHFQSDRVSYITPIHWVALLVMPITFIPPRHSKLNQSTQQVSAIFILSTAFRRVPKCPYINFGELECRRVGYRSVELSASWIARVGLSASWFVCELSVKLLMLVVDQLPMCVHAACSLCECEIKFWPHFLGLDINVIRFVLTLTPTVTLP